MKTFAIAVSAVAALFFYIPSAVIAGSGSSTIDPTQPAFGSPNSSTVMRSQFQAAINDINALIKNNSGATAPTSPALGQMWLNTSVNPFLLQQYDGSMWVVIGSVNPSSHAFSAYSGGVPTGTAANQNIGTSGATIGLLNADKTDSGTDNFTGIFQRNGTAQTFPASGNIVGTTDTQTLTNKSIAGSEINSGVVGSAYGGAGSVNGLMKANGSGAVSQATAGTDYDTPANVATAIGTALPSGTTSQLYGGTGSAGVAGVVGVGSGLSLSGGTLTATGGGSGALTLISTQSGTGLSTLQWTGISSSIHDVQLRCHGLSASTTVDPPIQLGIGATPTWITSGYYQQGGISRNGATGSVANDASDNAASWNPLGSGSISTTTYASMVLDVSNLQLSYGQLVYYQGQAGSRQTQGGSDQIVMTQYAGNVAPGSSVTAIRILPSGATISGSCSLYAYSGTS